MIKIFLGFKACLSRFWNTQIDWIRDEVSTCQSKRQIHPAFVHLGTDSDNKGVVMAEDLPYPSHRGRIAELNRPAGHPL